MLSQNTSSIISVHFTEKSIELIQWFGERSKEEKNVGASSSIQHNLLFSYIWSVWMCNI